MRRDPLKGIVPQTCQEENQDEAGRGPVRRGGWSVAGSSAKRGCGEAPSACGGWSVAGRSGETLAALTNHHTLTGISKKTPTATLVSALRLRRSKACGAFACGGLSPAAGFCLRRSKACGAYACGGATE